VTLISSSNHDLAYSGAMVVTKSPVPVITIPAWLSAAHFAAQAFESFAVLDTTSPGRFQLFSRRGLEEVNSVEPPPQGLAGLLKVDPKDPSFGDDLLLTKLAQNPKLKGVLADLEPSQSFSDRFESVANDHNQTIASILLELVQPIASSLSAAMSLANCAALVCTGAFFDPLGTLFKDTFLELMNSYGPRTIPELIFANEYGVQQVGGWLCARKVISQAGVWESRGVRTLGFEVRCEREVRYRVLHSADFAFDPHNPTIAELVGSRPVFAVVDEKIDGLYGGAIRAYFNKTMESCEPLLVDGSESKKNWTQVATICKALADANVPRQGVLMAIGGGVALDMAGLGASLFRRGVDYVRIPTSLIAMVDVGVGIKQAINFEGKKSLLGAFYPASCTVIDPTFLSTVSARDISCGIAEIIKIAMVKDQGLFELLEENMATLVSSKFRHLPVGVEIIAQSGRLMMEELQPNLFEEDLQRIVDFGHTFSPSIEIASAYRFAHGEAVAIDILLSTYIAVQRGTCDAGVLDRLVRLMRAAGLPLTQTVCTVDDFKKGLTGIRSHRGGKLNLVLPRALGRVEFTDELEDAELIEALEFCSRCGDLSDVSNID
jgi:3-dehydroquinate synthase